MPPVTGCTQVYLLVADPIDHVKSPAVFNAYFAERGLDLVMVPAHVDPENLATFVAGCRRWQNLAGIGVTVPHKKQMARLVDACGAHAAVAGAVNVVRREPDGRLDGDALDGVGFVIGLRRHGTDPAGVRALVVGAGGAARSVALALADGKAARVDVANRTTARAEELVARIHRHYPSVASEVVPPDPAGYGLVVNGTILGMRTDDPLPVDPARLDQDALVAEVVMNPEVTPLLEAASARGAAVLEGRHMLTGQVAAVVDFLLHRA